MAVGLGMPRAAHLAGQSSGGGAQDALSDRAAMDTNAVPSPSPGSGPLPAWRAMVARGELAPDPSQEYAARHLQTLWEALRGYDPAAVAADRRQRAAAAGCCAAGRSTTVAPEGTPKGIYLVGEVGRGKSMLMDLFFASAEVARKQRIHFHRFMQTSHARVFAWKQANPDGTDPIPPLADTIARDAALLCFDEFQVNDIADAMILGRLFQALFARGVVVVATSNVAPDDLFKGQPGRDAFLPFIALIKQRLDVVMMDAGRDFRRERMRGMRTWHVPADAFSRRALDEAFATLTGGVTPQPVTLTVTGRKLVVPAAAEGVARFDFADVVRDGTGAGGLSGDRDEVSYVGAGWDSAAVAGQLRRGAAVHQSDRYVVRSAGEVDRVGRCIAGSVVPARHECEDV